MSSVPAMTTTSYAILGLLAVKPWTTHELVQQIDRSMRRFWPRAQSKLYEEPKKLVALGLARAADDSVGRRRRTRYTITGKGRQALASWLQEPGQGPVLECEMLVKLHFSDNGSKSEVLANLAAARRWVLAENQTNLETAQAFVEGHGEFRERAAINQLVGGFLTEYYAMVARWVDWASRLVDDWPEDVRDASFSPAAAAELVRVATSVEQMLAGESSGRSSGSSD